MIWYQWMAIIALLVCLLSCIYHFYKILSLGNPPEYARRAGHIGKAVKYSFTGAMSPKVKESAYMHIPTYVAGIIYHLGTFLAIFVFFLVLFNIWLQSWVMWTAVVMLVAAGLCGVGILIKRMSKHELRTLSSPDDYISNILVTVFQLITAMAMIDIAFVPAYFILVSLLMLYFPCGEAKACSILFRSPLPSGLFLRMERCLAPKTHQEIVHGKAH